VPFEQISSHNLDLRTQPRQFEHVEAQPAAKFKNPSRTGFVDQIRDEGNLRKIIHFSELGPGAERQMHASVLGMDPVISVCRGGIVAVDGCFRTHF
jgi:hypothetical protein